MEFVPEILVVEVGGSSGHYPFMYNGLQVAAASANSNLTESRCYKVLSWDNGTSLMVEFTLFTAQPHIGIQIAV